jgi:uncharacterized membrane protein YoaK (UPF0700 family)
MLSNLEMRTAAGSSTPSVILGRDAMLLVLTWAAGTVDAVSYLGLGHVFTAMMTGNTVLLGLALAQGEIHAALRSILALLGFALGVTVGAVIVEHDESDDDWPACVTAALAVESVILAVFAFAWHFTDSALGGHSIQLLIVLLGSAMGVQAAAVRRLDVPGIATTYLTGTITTLFTDVVSWSRAPGHHWHGPSGDMVKWEQRVGLLAAVFLVYGVGALCGGLLYAHYTPAVSVAPLVAVVAVTMNGAFRHRTLQN